MITSQNIKQWYNNNEKQFEPFDDVDVGHYKLNINRPFWFTNPNNCDDIESIVFTGKSQEEIFVKMYKHCLTNLVWKGGKNDGKPVDLLDYLTPYNEILNKMVYKINGEYAIKSEYVDQYYNDSDDSDDEADASGGMDFLINNNKEMSYKILLTLLIRNKMMFYGFDDMGMCDCCFSVTELETV